MDANLESIVHDVGDGGGPQQSTATGGPDPGTAAPDAMVDGTQVGDPAPESAPVKSDEKAGLDLMGEAKEVERKTVPVVASKAKVALSRRMVDLVEDAGAEFFHSPAEDAFARIEVGSHTETLLVKSAAFRRFLTGLLFRADGVVAKAQDMGDAVRFLESKAILEGAKNEVYVRVAKMANRIVLDLGDPDWRTVVVGSDGWYLEEASPVCFRRGRGMGALPVPQRGGSLKELWKYLNIADERSRLLVLGWLLGALRGGGPFAVLVLIGEQGSGKSTAARMIKSFIDPTSMLLRAIPRSERDLFISAAVNHVLAMDNLSTLQDWHSDMICKVATGGGLATRELFTDAEEIIFDAVKPQILNGIGGFLERPDLVDRSVVVEVPKIEDAARQDEDSLWEGFREAHPRLLGALLDSLSAALRNLPDVHLEASPRMADFARFATAAETAMGYQSGDFVRAYTESRLDVLGDSIAENPIALALTLLVADANWAGTYTDLLKALTGKVEERTAKEKFWPRSPGNLSAVLKRLAPDLRRIGLSVEAVRDTGRARRKHVTVSRQDRPHRPPESPPAATLFSNWRKESDDQGAPHPTPDDADDADDADDENPPATGSGTKEVFTT